MTTNNVFAWSGTAGSNADVAGNGITGSSNISLGNDVFQNIMAQITNGMITRGSDIATASTVDFTAATTPSLLHDLTGTTTVTAVTMTAGWWRLCRAQGAFQLTASSALVVNGSTSTNYTTTAGDLLIFFGYSASTVRVWTFTGGATGAASTSTAGTVKLATLAQTLAQSPAGLVPTIENLYFPTGHLYGLTLSNNAGSAANKIDIAAGTARDDSDSYNMVLSATITAKDVTSSWAVGSSAGGLDTGAVGNSKYYVWLIERTDRTVVDVLFSLSSTSPTMPTNYTIKVLVGEFTRAAATNGTPLWYGPSISSGNRVTITLGTPIATTSGSTQDFTGIPVGVRRVSLMLVGVSSNGTAQFGVQVGSGSVSTSGYLGSGAEIPNGTTGSDAKMTQLFIRTSGLASNVLHGLVTCQLVDAGTNTWVLTANISQSDAGVNEIAASTISLSGPLDRIRLTANGDTFDAGKINISWEY